MRPASWVHFVLLKVFIVYYLGVANVTKGTEKSMARIASHLFLTTFNPMFSRLPLLFHGSLFLAVAGGLIIGVSFVFPFAMPFFLHYHPLAPHLI